MKALFSVVTVICLAVVFAAVTMTTFADNDTPNPYLKPDETWISISGQAVETMAESFILDYGKGTVKVEMDDWDTYDENFERIEGHKVTVYGMVDDDLFETTTIEASSVYDENLGTYFFASAADEEYDDDYDYWIDGDPVVIGQTTVLGRVTSVSGREFTIDTGPRKLTVDTIMMNYNPMDDTGFQKIEVGDYVSATGSMDYDAWEEKELMADYVITLEQDREDEE